MQMSIKKIERQFHICIHQSIQAEIHGRKKHWISVLLFNSLANSLPKLQGIAIRYLLNVRSSVMHSTH